MPARCGRTTLRSHSIENRYHGQRRWDYVYPYLLQWAMEQTAEQIIHFKIEWNNGLAYLYLPDGSKQACRTKGKLGNDVLIAGLRYAWLGGVDEELNLTFPGLRFWRARLVDLDK